MSLPDAPATRDLEAFESGRLEPADFPHAEHIRMGYEMLGRHSFPETIVRFSAGLRRLAGKAGKPQIYHETITIAFLALINERRVGGTASDWPGFKAENSDLFDKRCLEKWYDADQLGSDLARTTFCLPSRKLAAQGAAV